MGTTYVTAQDLVNLGWSSEKATPEMVADLNSALEKFGITEPDKIQFFLGQCSVESGLGRYTRELTDKDYDGSQYEPGTRAGRNLGNLYPGDGPKFMGGGYMNEIKTIYIYILGVLINSGCINRL